MKDFKDLSKIFAILLLILVVVDLSIGFLKKKKGLMTGPESMYIQPLDSLTPTMAADLFWDEREIYGEEHNSVIVKMSQEFLSWVNDDEIPWCSSFVNYTSALAGYELSGKLNARSWENIGVCSMSDPRPGDIVVLWRTSKYSWKGHVGYFVRFSDDGKYIYLKGGNQSNRVNITKYPIERLVTIRRTGKIKYSSEGAYKLNLEDVELSEK